MTQSEPVTQFELGDEALAEADGLVALLSRDREWEPHEGRDLIAAAIQRHINAAELAEAERQHAVRAAQAFRERVLEAAARAHVETWATCPRCHVRAPSVLELKHAPGCRLSSAPPPRRSLIAPKPGGEG